MDKNTIEKKYQKLKKKIDALDFISTGSIMKVYNTCGRPGCECYKDKSKKHGPYNIWTRKVNAKTVTRTLTKEQARMARQYVANMRKFEKITRQMKDLSAQYIQSFKKKSKRGGG